MLAASLRSQAPYKRSHYRAGLGKAFCAILSEGEKSVTRILQENPGFPAVTTLYRWREQHPAFARLWHRARQAQAEHLMQKCLDLARDANPRNAHAVRVKFDIYRCIAGKFSPEVYGDKPSTTSVQTSVAVVISPERLEAIRESWSVRAATSSRSMKKPSATKTSQSPSKTSTEAETPKGKQNPIQGI